MKIFVKWFTRLILMSAFSVYGAVSAVDQLSERLKSFSTYQANFKQETFSLQGRLIQKSHGTMKIKRPGKFRWESLKPTQQLLITDGKTLWIYDADLQQVSQQQLLSRTSIDPAMLLSGSVKNLSDTFNVSVQATKGEEIFILLPKKTNFGFKQIKMTFKQGQLTQMVVENNLSQISQFDFSNILLNRPLANDVFTFKPPAGVDVISQ